MNQANDNTIWAYCLQGNREAFKILYIRYYAILYNYGKKFTTDNGLVKDCIQNFFVKLICNHKNLSDTKSVNGYLLKAFRYTLYNALKSENIRNGVFVFCVDNILYDEHEESDNNTTSSDITENLFISTAFRQLSSRQQEILYLYYIRELTHEEIAEILNINYQSSKNLLFRTILKLRTLLLNDPKWSDR